MTPLIVLGVACLVFTAVFTYRAYHATPGVGQSPRSAIIEAWMNIAIGFSVNFFANMLILPLVEAHITASQNFWMGWIYTSISILRQYAIRRWFNARLHAVAMKLSGAK